ncbi:MAG: DUF4277 domain-containing protein [Microcystaceae cyanobacterium]
MSPISEIKVKNIDHLGIVAGLIDEIGIVETINSKLGIDRREKISSGTVGFRLTSRPTLRWIFQCCQGLHLLTLNGVNQIVNLTEERHFILNFLPSSCQKYYLFS